ncbi:hypothetical protein GCM10029992_40450 [Glycomyces albus]
MNDVSAGPAAVEWRRGRRLGIDLGKARIGVATCDPDGILASPVATVRRDMRTGGEEIPRDIRELAEIASEYEVVEIVVGLPVTLSGEEDWPPATPGNGWSCWPTTSPRAGNPDRRAAHHGRRHPQTS